MKHEVRILLSADLKAAVDAYRWQRKLETGKLLMYPSTIIELLEKATAGIEREGPATVAEFRAAIAELDRITTGLDTRVNRLEAKGDGR